MVEKDRLLQELDACHQQLEHGRQRQPTPNVLDVSKLHDELLTGPLARHEEFKVDVVTSAVSNFYASCSKASVCFRFLLLLPKASLLLCTQVDGGKKLFSARCNIYIWRLCYSVSVRLSVCQSVCDGSALAHYS